MMKFRVLLLSFFLLLALAGCGTFQVSVETDAAPTQPELGLPPKPTASEATLPVETPFPTLIPVPDLYLKPPQVLGIPELVWLPYGEGARENQRVLVISSGEVSIPLSPVEIAMYWDYGRASGRLAYSSRFWAPEGSSPVSSSDLWVYDYRSAERRQWLAANVVRAQWSPAVNAVDERLAAVLFNPTSLRYELALVNGAEQVSLISNCASPHFAWSPDGKKIAFVVDASLGLSGAVVCPGTYVADFEANTVKQVSEFGAQPLGSGWIGDKPVWIPENNALVYADAPFWVVPLDGSPAFVPQDAQGAPPSELLRPTTLLWSPAFRQLVGETTSSADLQGVWVYQLSDDLRQIVQRYRIGGEGSLPRTVGDLRQPQIVGWLTPFEYVFTLDLSTRLPKSGWGNPSIWGLKERDWFPIGGPY